MMKRIVAATAAMRCSRTSRAWPPAAEPVAAELTIHADKPGAKIDANIYGQFMEHLGRNVYEGIWVGENSTIPNTRGYRNDVLAALKKLQVPVLRWPGGCFADEYHWRDGIGARDKRPAPRQHLLGRRHRAQRLRHARVLRARRDAGRQDLPRGERGLGHGRRDVAVGRVHHLALAIRARQRAPRERPRQAVEARLRRRGQRALGLRRRHARRVLRGRVQEIRAEHQDAARTTSPSKWPAARTATATTGPKCS